MRFNRTEFFGNKFTRDVFWNMLSTGLAAVAGIVLVLVIGRFYGSAPLGVFNQVYAVYIIASQFAVGGIHYSVIRYVPQYKDEQQTCNQIITSAITVAIPLAVTVSLIVWALRDSIGLILSSPDTADSLIYVVPGIAAFAINKVMMAILNGYRRMKAYALFQAVHAIVIMVLLAVMLVMDVPYVMLPLILTGAETVRLVLISFYSLSLFRPVLPKLKWLREHVVFGLKAFPSGVFTEINTVVDRLMLGLFTSDAIVGIYSLAAMFVEGFNQIVYVLRININPLLTQMYFSQREKLTQFLHRGIKMSYIFIAILAVVACSVYPLVAKYLAGGGDFMKSWPLFCILMVGVGLSGGYLPFLQLLNQAGRPWHYSMLLAMTVVSNIILCAILIPFWDMYGAAAATATATVLGVMYLKYLSRRVLQIRI